MEKLDLQKFKSALQKRDSRIRFKVEKFTADIPDALLECYQNEVEKRNMDLIIDSDTKLHISKAAKWLTSGNKIGILFYGPVGNGKTTLIRSIMILINTLYYSDIIAERKFLRIVSALELAEMAKNESGKFIDLKNTELLAIDDVGIEPSIIKSWGNEISPFVDIIYHRYDRQLFTILSSNLNNQELEEKYGERIWDRFNEMFDKISFQNKSYRK